MSTTMTTTITLTIDADLIAACEAQSDEIDLYRGHLLPEDAASLLVRYEQSMRSLATAEYGDGATIEVDTTQIRCSGATRCDRITIDSDDHYAQQRAEDWLQEAKMQAWQQACG
jgi:glutamine synthetase adenylyltransferase